REYEREGGGYVDRAYPQRIGRADLIRALPQAKRVLRSEIPTRDAKERERRARMLSAHVPIDGQAAKAWALASIAIGFEPACKTAKEFWGREKNWKTAIRSATAAKGSGASAQLRVILG